MPKSKYPQQIDTSVEIPPVRDNILEAGSDVINSLRSAIFNIERTLGINPQGAAGNSVSERINKSLDGNGNIKPEALTRANVLAGPIHDADVSKVAAIKEEKLKLDFPTKVLQSEISIINSNLDDIIQQVENMVTELSIHINTSALNRHPATAISVAPYSSLASDIAIKDLTSGSVQSTFQNILDSHINYSGVNIGGENNSHLANQIFFDKTNVSSYVTSDDVQGSLEEVILSAFNYDVTHQDLMHSNGILKSGYILNPGDADVGNILDQDISISFSASTGLSSEYTTILVNDPVDLSNFDLRASDILTIYNLNGSDSTYNGSYEIVKYTLSGSNLATVTVIGNFYESSSIQTVARISKNIKKETNPASLLIAAREEPGLTSCRTAQICNPNSVCAISSGFNASEVSTTKRYIGVSINGDAPVTLDLLYTGTSSGQTLDSIIKSINKQCVENAYDFLAYRLDNSSAPSELVIAHNLPDSSGERFTLTISRELDDGIDAVGFSHIEDQVQSSIFGTSYYLQGKAYQGLGVKLDSTQLSFSSNSTIIDSGTSGINFISSGIKVFDIIIVSGAESSSDNGSYIITNVSSDTLTVSSVQLPSGFAGSSLETTRFRIYSNIVSFNNITFDSVSAAFGSGLYEVCLDADRKIFVNKAFEYTTQLSGINSKVILVDFYGADISGIFDLEVVKDLADDSITLTLDGGQAVEVSGLDSYVWVKSGSRNVSLNIYIPDSTYIASDFTMTFFGFELVNSETNLKLGKVAFNNYNGRITGGRDSGRILSYIDYGTQSEDNISTSAKKSLLEVPRSELRSCGVVSGLEVLNSADTDGFYSFEIKPGVCYVRGKRIEYPGKSLFITDIDFTSYDKIFIAIDYFGNVIIQKSTAGCLSPIESSDYCILSTVEYASSVFYTYDLRLFIDNIDLKLLNSITVSPQPGMGHFTEFGKAVKYAKRFSQIFPKAGVPTIHLKSGIHNITVEFDYSDSFTFASYYAQSLSITNQNFADGLFNAGLVIDFPVSIVGEGESTELNIRSNFKFSDVEYNYKGVLAVYGVGYSDFSVPMTLFESGFINFSNFKMSNCRIYLVDMNVIDGVNNLNFMISIDNVIFDHQNFTDTNPFDAILKFASIDLSQVNNISTNKGNLSINNCKFIVDPAETSGSAILIANASLTKNLFITNNNLINGGSGTSLISSEVSTFSSANTGSNITLTGNNATGNFLTSDSARAKITASSTDWVDRISRGLNVGGLISTNNDFTYLQSKELSQVYLFNIQDSLEEMIPGPTGTFTSSIFTTIVGTPYTFNLRTAYVPSGRTISVILDRLPLGAKIKEVSIGLDSSLSTTINMSIDRLTESFSLKGSEYSSSLTTEAIAPLTPIRTLYFTGINLTTDTSGFYFVSLSHNKLTPVSFYYIKVVFEITNISNALGLV